MRLLFFYSPGRTRTSEMPESESGALPTWRQGYIALSKSTNDILAENASFVKCFSQKFSKNWGSHRVPQFLNYYSIYACFFEAALIAKRTATVKRAPTGRRIIQF